MKRLISASIKAYQSTGGGRRWFGVICNFDPTCSEYTLQAIERYGVLRGLKLGFGRIRRCNDPDLPQPIKDPLK
jgi:putative membrane protein insertion efficiency factor